jgi:hypothetical protein
MRGQIIEKSKTFILSELKVEKMESEKPYFQRSYVVKKVKRTTFNEKLVNLIRVYCVISKRTLDDYLTRWLETVTKYQVTEATFDNYKMVVRVHIKRASVMHDCQIYEKRMCRIFTI